MSMTDRESPKKANGSVKKLRSVARWGAAMLKSNAVYYHPKKE